MNAENRCFEIDSKGKIDRDNADVVTNPDISETLADIASRRADRRTVLKGILAAGIAAGVPFARSALASKVSKNTTLRFDEIAHEITPDHHVADGYSADILIRWGDGIFIDSPEFDPANLRADDQERQFGYNCDFIGYLPLPIGSNNPNHGLLCVNHEYSSVELMWQGANASELSKEQSDYDLSAHGHSIVEIIRRRGKWRIVANSQYNRRISARTTEMLISGPAAGHERLRTPSDPAGRRVIGTLNNCAGGVTPWGTILTCEENFDQYFGGTLPADHTETENFRRMGMPAGDRARSWYKYHERFDMSKQPNEANRFGYVVEIDPYNPDSTPVKRTALGRFKHEGATVWINRDRRVVVYSGDDQAFEFIYKFVSRRRYDPADREANMNLLDDGKLFVAKFEDNGTMRWLPLVFGEDNLTPENGFHSQADICIETRRAASIVGVTPLDRPEDVEANPVTGRVYAMLTNNSGRTEEQIDEVNPRAHNNYGQIIEMRPPGEGPDSDHTANVYEWDLLIVAGDPRNPEHHASYHPDVSENGWLVCPDNCAFDNQGRLWIATDQGSAQERNGIPDGIYATDTIGDGRGLTRFFYRVPRGAEMCGPFFTSDNKTLFVSVQHPAEGSSYADPWTRWPDFKDGVPPRPSVVAITKDNGGIIGD
ncbi:MAG: PhoX family phosphatase [Planctomycetes bacterium]|nr:PhoX family phosphatase [Planctomycetota bacterium]